jgi:outer membrane protein
VTRDRLVVRIRPRRPAGLLALTGAWLLVAPTVLAQAPPAQTFNSPAAAVPAAGAQPTPLPAGPLSLEQVLELAEGRSESVAIARNALQRNQGEQVRARSGRYPQLSASANYERSIVNEFSGVFDTSGGVPCPAFALDQTAPLDARVGEIERAIDCGAVGGNPFSGSSSGLSNLPFGRANTWRATLAFSQSLYSGGRLGLQSDLAAVGLESANLALAGARAQLRFDVIQAYYDAALSDRLVAIAEATVEQATATLRQTQAGFDAGTQPEFEVLRARVGRDNQTPQLIRQRISRELAFQRLKQLLELPVDARLELGDVLGDQTLAPAPIFAERVAVVEKAIAAVADPMLFGLLPEAPLPARTVVAEAETAVRLRETSLRLTEAERKPILNLTSTYSRIAFPSGVFPAFDRSNWAIGAAMSVPILTGGRQRGDEIVAQANLEDARLQRKQTAELAALDTRSAWAELVAARAVWQASAGTVEQASRAYEIADVRFRAGVSTQLELSDSRLLLQQAEANRAQAARDLQVVRARIALLPDLPLGAATTAAGARTPAPAAPPAQPAAQSGTQVRSASAQTGALQTGTR